MEKLRKLNTIFFVLLAFLIYSCDTEKQNVKSDNSPVNSGQDPLPSWNEGKTKSDILSYVKLVTDQSSDNFIPVKDRIATFDND